MKNNNCGQSTIEFLTCFSFIIAIFFLYVKMAINITNGYLLHYATYMASRAYMVYDVSGAENQDAQAAGVANIVFKKITSGLTLSAKGVTMKANHSDTQFKPFVGIYATMDQAFSYSKLVGGAKIMHYVSESFLGREPTTTECLLQICKAYEALIGDGVCAGANRGMTMVDNGC